MDQILRDFIVALRASGVRISVAESIDAMNTAKLIGYEDRTVLKDSLSVVLAKSYYEKELFVDCFSRFFSFDAFSHQRGYTLDNPSTDQRDGNSLLTQMILAGDTSALAASMREAAQDLHVNQMQYFTQKGIYMHRILRHMGQESLRRDIQRLYQENTEYSREIAERLTNAEDYLLENVRDYVEQQYDLFAGSLEEELLENYLKDIKLSNLEQRDLYRMHTIVHKMVKRLNDIHSKRRRTFRRGQLDFRKTLRNNVANQGLLFDIKWKKKKIDQPNIVAICDVSSSVSAVARFLLIFLYSLNKALAKIRTFIFCSNLVEVSNIFDEYSVEEAVAKLHSGTGLGVILGPTDYGQSFRNFRENWPNIVTNNTTVLILGDARNNYTDPETRLLKAIQQRCKRLIWLNPESPSSWGTGDSEMHRYRPYCHVAKECNTVNHLERVVDSILDR